jgi:hypothetical protein
MNIREKLKANSPSPESEPTWVKDGTESARKLFVSTKAEYLRVKDIILNAKNDKDRKQRLVLSKIAKGANKCRSLVNPRRQPELCQWIKELNLELDGLEKSFSAISKSKPSRRELESELSSLKREIRTRIEQDQRDLVEAFFSSNLLEDRDKLARDNCRLKLENEQLMDKIARLQSSLNEYHSNHAEILSLLTVKQRALLQRLSPI